jgi:ATP-dependent HslUV protease ATP-binding subunit HslU
MSPTLTPAQTVQWLDKHVIGQSRAKRTVAIALRNRHRRKLVDEPVRSEIYPSNLIMMGPTGVGKTEIARRMAVLVGAPFVKVEATKYTETGYVGRDVESMVRDLVRQAVNLATARARESKTVEAMKRVNHRLMDALKKTGADFGSDAELKRMLDNGSLDGRDIELAVSEKPPLEILPMVPGMDNSAGEQLKGMFEKILGQRCRLARMKVEEARARLLEEETSLLLEGGDHVQEGLRMAQEEGIIFIDEIDKIIGSDGGAGPDVSRMGVQRDLLPILEGSTVATRYGPVKTDHILFIAAGAFNGSSPSDLVPELQGRFPLRVALDPLGKDELLRILREPEGCLLRQYTELLAADGVSLKMDGEACEAVAETAQILNQETEDIGARRLRPVLAYLLDDYLFGAPDQCAGRVRISGRFARDRLAGLVERRSEDSYIL